MMRYLIPLLLFALPAHALEHLWQNPTIGQNEGHLDFPSHYTVTAEYDADAWPHNGWLRLISEAVGPQTPDHRFMISDGNSGNIRVRACADGNTIVLLGSGLSLEPQRADVTFDGSFARVFLDGTQVSSAPLSGQACPSDGADLLLGAQPPGGSNQFQGTIDYIRIRDYAMTEAEIQAEMGQEPVNSAPTAVISAPSNVATGSQVTLDGSGSTDPENDPLSYAWVMTVKPAGSAASLSDPAIAMPTFTADLDGAYVNELTVDDGEFSDVASATTSTAPSGNFAELCAHPSVRQCFDFDAPTSLNQAASNNGANCTFPPAIDSFAYEGGGSLRHTIDANEGFDMSCTTGWAFESVTSGSVFVSWRQRTGNGFWEHLKNGAWSSTSGIKFIQIAAGSRSCSGEAVTLSDNFVQNASTGYVGLTTNCASWAFRDGGNWQPLAGVSQGVGCGYTYTLGQRPGQPQSPPCVLMDDDTWHLLTIEIALNQGVKLWIDNVLTIDWPSAENGSIPPGPYARVFFDNYATGHQGGEMNHLVPGPTWPVHYDNLIISTECVTGC